MKKVNLGNNFKTLQNDQLENIDGGIVTEGVVIGIGIATGYVVKNYLEKKYK